LTPQLGSHVPRRVAILERQGHNWSIVHDDGTEVDSTIVHATLGGHPAH
jgi:hypothetical protein